MNARKLPSGRWQSKVYIGTVDGKKKFVSITESTRKECLLKAAAVQAEKKEASNFGQMTVDQAIDKYIEAKRAVLSPATVLGYSRKRKRYISSHTIGTCTLDKLTTQNVQKWISDISVGLSRKTVQNIYGIFTASLSMFTDKKFKVRLPQGKKYKGYVPSTLEVLQVLAYAKEHNERLYRACLLTAFGTFRRSELACLTAEDIDGNTIHVSKDTVLGDDGKYHVKLPKTTDSVRDVPMPQWIIDEMPKEGLLVGYNPDEITKWFIRMLPKVGVPHFRFHDLRKHAASLMALHGVSLASVKTTGGWSNMRTPMDIYIKALSDAHEREMGIYMDYVSTLKP